MEELKAADIGHMLAERLARTTGRPKGYWLTAIGEIETLAVSEHPNCNWRVTPTVTGDDLFAISRVVEVMRFEHPYIIDVNEQRCADSSIIYSDAGS